MKFDDINPNVQDNKPMMCPAIYTASLKDDTNFYRKAYYPNVPNAQQSYNKGDGNQVIGLIMPTIHKGVNHYIKKFDLSYEANDLILK